MPLIANEDFDKKVEFMGDRINTCMFRFHQMLQTRRKEFAKIVDQPQDEVVKDGARHNILGAADRYVNCLRNEYEDQVPATVQPLVEQFKRKLYSDVQHAWVLEDHRLKIAEALYEANK